MREIVHSADRVARAIADFQAPEGVDPAEATRLRAEAGHRAAFDTSKEARQARSYELAAERGFFRALRELRLVEKQAKKAAGPAVDVESFRQMMGSFLEMKTQDDEFDARCAEMGLPPLPNSCEPATKAQFHRWGGGVDLPFTIGKGR